MRCGPENMAVDEWLLGTAEVPVLRIYDWDGEWVSLGYFDRLAEAKRLFPDPGLRFVRRATGGGVVDHRADQTYTLVVPKQFGLAQMRGAESYRVIHAALAETIRAACCDARLVMADAPGDSAACFEKPVAWDLTDAAGRKIAGAGQRRTNRGLLHQGSVQGAGVEVLGELAGRLAAHVEVTTIVPDKEAISALVAGRFGTKSWLERR